MQNSKDTTSFSDICLNIMLVMLTLLTMSSRPAETGPVAAFQKLADRLTALETVKYRYVHEFSYPAESYYAKSEGDMYVDFAKNNDVAGFRYQNKDDQGFSIFNNSEKFHGSLKDKTIKLESRIKLPNLEGSSALYNSIPTLRNILPLIIKDDSIPKYLGDTLVDKRSYHLLTFVLQNRTLNYTGTGFTRTSLPLTFIHKLIVDKATGLPLTLLQTRKNSQNLNRTDFLNIETNPPAPSEKSWYYSTYLNEYKIEDAKRLTTIAPGQTAPHWELTNYNSGSKETLAKYKGKVILLEFWIRHCGYCIEAVSKLNQLHEKYKSNKFQILAINTEASHENIKQFASKHPMKYTVMYGDNSDINKSYGIDAFPLVVLIGKDGKVVYSGALDIEKLERLIKSSGGM